MSEWTGRTAMITGGGRGFGKALAKAGAHAVMLDIDGAVAESAAAEIRAAGGSAEALGDDVTDEVRLVDVMAQAAKTNGGIDLLINNAGLHSEEYGKTINILGLAKVRRLVDVNLIGVVACTLAALPHIKGGWGRA